MKPRDRKCVKCTVAWTSRIAGYGCPGSADGHATVPIAQWSEQHEWVDGPAEPPAETEWRKAQ